MFKYKDDCIHNCNLGFYTETQMDTIGLLLMIDVLSSHLKSRPAIYELMIAILNHELISISISKVNFKRKKITQNIYTERYLYIFYF